MQQIVNGENIEEALAAANKSIAHLLSRQSTKRSMKMSSFSKANVLLIAADDMGYGDFGVFSEGRVNTPNLDRLVGEGVCLQQHYSGSPICSPARAALLTGRYPHRSGAITQHDMFGLDRIALRETTIADMFKDSGYKTGLVGKWHNGSLDLKFEPNARGFDDFAGFCGGWSDYYKWHLQTNSSYTAGSGEYLTDVLTDQACGFVDRNKEDPFFLMLAYSAPHSPFQAPQDLIDPYLAKGFDRITATTYAMIEAMDAGIGRILDKLDANGLAENTIVMFTSDNGPAFFNPPFMLNPGEKPFNERFNAGLKGSKGWVHEGGIRVPMVLRFPAGLPANVMNRELCHFTDWLPTLASLCDIPAINRLPLDGHDLSNQLRGEKLQVQPRRFWQWNFYYPSVATNAAVRDGDWKLVRPMIAGTRYYKNPDLYLSEEDAIRTAAFIENDIKHKENPTSVTELLPVPRIKYPEAEQPELYNLADDPGEQNNLAVTRPDITSRLLCELETWFESVEADRNSIDDPLHRPSVMQ